MRSSLTLAGVSGAIADCTDGISGCYVVGPNYQAAAVSGASAGKILAGESVAGVAGNVGLPPVGKVLTGTSFGVGNVGSSGTLHLPTANNVLSGSGTYGDPGSPLTPSLTLPAASYVRTLAGNFGIGGSGSVPTLEDCAANNVAGCVTSESYKSADWTNLAAANIKYNTTIAGVTGTYPSAGNPLAGNTGVADLTSFGSATTAGSYEFFDSAGNRYTATVAAGGTQTPTTTDQTFSNASTLYNGFTVKGDTALAAANIKSGVTLFTVPGSVIEESHNNCASNGSQNCIATGSYYAATNCSSNGSQSCYATGSYYAAAACAANSSTCFVPAYALGSQPLKAISYDAISAGQSSMRSSLTLAGVSGAIADCTDGISGCYVVGPNYQAAAVSGASAGKILAGESVAGVAGNVGLPPVGKVLTGTSFGVGNVGSAGTLTLPLAVNVLSGSGSYGDPSGSLTPTLTLPATGKVLTGTIYGAGGTGASGALTLPLANNVIAGSGAYGDPGALMTPAHNPSFPPLIVRPAAPTISTTAYYFSPDRVTLSWRAVSGVSGLGSIWRGYWFNDMFSLNLFFEERGLRGAKQRQSGK